MSVLHPVGPLPPRVYWVRRIVLVVVIVLVLLLAAWAWGAVSGDGGGGASGPSPSASSPSPTASTQSPSPTPSETQSPSPSASSTPAATPSCADDVIRVTATPSKTSYAQDEDPRFTIKVTNSSKKACKRDVGQKAMEIRVSQGDSLVWSSDHCNPGGEPKVVTLKAGDSYSTSVVWSRTTSKEGCPDGEPDASSGTYSLTGRNLKIVSDPVAFQLS